ncbi:uncharacterized protein LOC129958466 [Argiope bruennichi]|uniref:uncharacterized protein LOC129958466 n=1 Tax=Argiope bruennichi TaxID=94029 RepID=UPI0024950183|nr:uncharacterized protein LOC129958466 [Argiope bruennichi]
MEEVSAVKMPNFIPSDPSLWFTMVESTFELAIPKPITASRSKYNYSVSTLPLVIVTTVRDIILSPDITDPYSQLKSEIISRCGKSKSQEIRKLLAGEQLHDRKSSELLRIMQRRAENHNIIDSLLLELFLQQLPSNVQSILASIQPLTPQKASEIADKILDITPNQISHMRPSNSNYVSPLHMVPKKVSDDWCPVGDFRALKAQTKKGKYPISSA